MLARGIEPVIEESQSEALLVDHPAVQSRSSTFSAMTEIRKKDSESIGFLPYFFI